jgi:hypothetical protein
MVSTITDRLKGFSIGAAIKAPAVVATTGANITLSGTQTIDGVSVGATERVLVKDQTDGTENGIYVSDSSTWIRAADADGAKDLKPGTFLYVDRGTDNGQTFWVFNSSSTATSIVVGTDTVTMSQVTVALSGASAFGSSLVSAADASSALSILGLANSVASATLIATTDITANAVSFAKISTGTPNAIIAYSSTGELVEIISTSSDLVLTSNTTDVKPSWQAAGGAALPRGHQFGIFISNSTVDANHDIDFSQGIVRGSTDVSNISVTSSFIKAIDSSYAAGTGNGGMSTGTVAANTWYHTFVVIDAAATVDGGFDTSLNATNLTVEASSTDFRRRGSVLTDGSANIIAFTQIENEFMWTAPVSDYSADPSTSEIATTLTVPPDANITASLVINMDGSGRTHVHHPDVTSDTSIGTAYNEASGSGATIFQVRTNTSKQVEHLSMTGVTGLTLLTLGWLDDRGDNG